MIDVLSIFSLLCFFYVGSKVWFTKKDLSTFSKIVWTLMAFFFSLLTLIAFLIAQPHKDK